MQVKAAGTESVTRKCADKKLPGTAINIHRMHAWAQNQKTQSAKGTDNRAHAHTQQNDTGTAIGTETANVMR